MQSVVIMISGKQGSGKTATTSFLNEIFSHKKMKIETYKFAGPIYEMQDAVWAIYSKYGYEMKDFVGEKDGELLQWLGTQHGRKKDQDIWVNILKKRAIEFLREAESKSEPGVVMVDDLRFKNEFTAAESIARFGKVIRIRLECPEEIRKARMAPDTWRDNTTHQSEIDLDDWVDKFDLVVDTSQNLQACRKAIVHHLQKELGLL